MHILLLQDDPYIREKVSFVLQGQYNAKVSEAGTVGEARSLLKELKGDVNLLVIDCDRKKSPDADKLHSEFPDHQCIVFLHNGEKPLAVSAPPGRPTPVFVDRSDIVHNLLTTVGAMIKQSMLPNPEDDRNFCKIRTRLLLSVCPLNSDIYIRLSEAKYLKLFRQGDNFDLQDMEKYTVKKGVEYLYIHKDKTKDFIRKYQEELASYLEKKPDIDLNEAAKISDSVLETVQELSRSLGFTPEIQKMSKTQVALTMKAMGKSPRLSKIFDKLESYQGKYIASHSTLCGYLSCAIASQMKWGSDTTFYKLTLASFLHDISLSNHELAKCNTLEEADEGKFTDEEKKAFRSHPIRGAEIAKQFNEVPPDVDTIIAQHHERADSSGFPRGLSPSYIAPLSAIFIIAHDMTQFALERGNEFRPEQFIEAARERYKPSQFRKVIQAMERL